MMNSFAMLLDGFVVALTPMNLLVCGIGVIIGTLVGVLPGLGPASAIAILLPVTAVLSPAQAIIMLGGIYYGSQYGGSTTSILLNIPGEASSIATCLDGYPMAQKGRGGPALGIAAIGSFIAGTLGVVGLAFFGPVVAEYALKFGPPEFFALMLLSMSIIVNFAGDSIVKGLIMAVMGFVLSSVGMGPISGRPRLHFGSDPLTAGLEVVSLVIGLLAITEVLKALEEKQVAISSENVGSVMPSKDDMKRSIGPILRATAIGFSLGILPGCSPTASTFLSYDLEKKLSKHPEEFGHGAIEGVAGPESANNANGSAGFIPLFAFGIPCTATMAVLLSGLMINGVQPGPMMFYSSDGFVWTVIASMFIGNVMLLILNLPLVGVWAKITRIPYAILGPIILTLCIIGSYSIRNSLLDVFISLIAGMIGFVLYKFRWPIVPMLLGFILGPMLEESFVQSMGMGGDDLTIFFTRPGSLAIVIGTVIFVIISAKLMRRTKKRVSDVVGEDADLANTES